MTDFTPINWLKRICEYWKDKKLPEKCGMEVKDICAHEVKVKYREESKKYTCMKCGELVI